MLAPNGTARAAHNRYNARMGGGNEGAASHFGEESSRGPDADSGQAHQDQGKSVPAPVAPVLRSRCEEQEAAHSIGGLVVWGLSTTDSRDSGWWFAVMRPCVVTACLAFHYWPCLWASTCQKRRKRLEP